MSAADPASRSSEWGWRGGQSRFSGRVADPRLLRALRRLERLAGAAPELTPEPPRWGIIAARPPASIDQVAEAELRLGTALPSDYTSFLLRWNGMKLALPPGARRPISGELCLLGTDDLVRHAATWEGQPSSACIPDLLRFATVDAQGDGLAFATRRLNPVGGCAVLDARHDRHPERWWVIARDFAHWLDELLRLGRAATVGRDWCDERDWLQPPLPFEETDELEPFAW